MGRAGGALRIVVLGIMGRTPLAGVVWQAMHYLEGFRRLGHEVVYVEDTGAWPYDPEQNTLTEDVRYAVRTIEAAMTLLGLPDRWAYRAAPPGSRLFGLGEAELAQVCRDADVLVNGRRSISMPQGNRPTMRLASSALWISARSGKS